MLKRSLIRRTALVAGMACLASAAPAAADSILFVRDNDIYLATPDGSREFRVTSTAEYGTASQADDGTIIATAGQQEHLRKLDRFGNVLADFATPVSDGPTPANSSDDHFEGPYDPVISPDGTKVAYQYYWQHFTNNPGGCGGDPGCMGQRLESGTAITYPDRMTPWDVFGNLTGWGEPSWWGNDRILRSNAGVPMAENVVVNRIAPGLGSDDLTRWVKEAYTDERQHATITRDGRRLVAADEEWDQVPGSFRTVDGMRFYDASAGLGEAPKPCFRVNYTGSERTGKASWSPDGGKLVFEKDAGIEVMDVGDMTGCTGSAPAGTSEPRTLIAKGASPSWGPSDVPTSRPATQTGGPAQQGNGVQGGAATGGALKATVKAGKLAKTLKRGLVVRFTAPGKGTLRARAAKGKRVVAKGTAKPRKAGATSVKLRFSRAGRRALAGKRKATLSLRLTFTPATGAAVTQTVKVALKR